MSRATRRTHRVEALVDEQKQRTLGNDGSEAPAHAAGLPVSADPIAAAPASASSSASSGASSARARYRICIVSDFFYPRLGGVELHQYSLAQALQRRGHKVVVVTGTYEDEGHRRQGVRYCTGGMKVYYCPMLSISQQATLPTLFAFWPLLRSILLRERIQLVHGHQSTSSLAHEALLHARTMGLGCLFTDHSLFGFANAPAAHLNKLMKFTLTDAQHVICVSHCSKENLCLRAMLDPSDVSVIPNAVDTTKLTPCPGAAPNVSDRFTIVVLSRLVYRKGVDLIIDVIPLICARFPHVHFLVGGDGPKRVLLDQMREKYALQDRVELIGAVAHSSVRSVLTRGHLFLNASLTEAFCIAILEAVSCGLFVVSTRVGGVPEILPPSLMAFAEPSVPAIVQVLSEAIYTVRTRAATQPDYAHKVHAMVRDMYNWHDVAARTEKVYEKIMHQMQQRRRIEQIEEGDDDGSQLLQHLNDSAAAVSATATSSLTLPGAAAVTPSTSDFAIPGSWCAELVPDVSLGRLRKFLACGVFSGPLFVAIVLFDHILLLIMAWINPAANMDVAVDWDSAASCDDDALKTNQRSDANDHSDREQLPRAGLSGVRDLDA